MGITYPDGPGLDFAVLPKNEKGRQLRAALLRLLGMKCRFLRLQISDHLLKPFNRDLIGNRQEHFLIMLDLFVEFGALVAHGTIPKRSIIGPPDLIKVSVVLRPQL